MLNVSTKTGDTGKTSLASGERVAKTDPVISAIGEIDELNSWLGLVIADGKSHPKKIKIAEQVKFLHRIQHHLFTIGGIVAKAKGLEILQTDLDQLENQSIQLQKQMKGDWHSKFLLPGGSKLAAYLDLSRAVCRRVERSLWQIKSKENLPKIILEYCNRLSDYLYVLRCFVNYFSKYQEIEFKKD